MEQGHASSSSPSVSSSLVGMTSTKCAENVSKSSDLDCIIISQEDDLTAKKEEHLGKRKKPLKSEVWNHFDRFESDTKGTKKVDAICKYCHTRFNGASDQGTTHLKNHTKTCRMKLVKVPVSQMSLGKQVSSENSGPKLGVHKFDHAVERALFSKMIAKHDMPFLMAEYDYFRLWISYVMPSYKHRSRNTIKSDLLDVCHYIDDNWELHKRVISFRVVPYPHGGVNLSAWLKERILEWNIDNKLSSIVVDNASNNSGMLLGIKNWLNGKRDRKIHRIISQRDEKFTIALSQTKLNTRRRIPSHVDTRWNSTYDMIVASLELRPAIDRLKELDPEFKCLPSELEWENGNKIRRSIKIWAESSDDWISAMGNKMQLKFDKYWEECNKLLAVAVVLDPRYKMAIVSYAYKGIYDIHADFYVEEMREFLVQIFNEYSIKFGSNKGYGEGSASASLSSASSVGGEWLGGFQDFIASSNLRENTRKSEVDEYLKEGLFPMDKEADFDILRWWKLNGPKFPILARMAQDILAIPTSSVASENSFSKCRKIITDTRSSLNDDSVETLMCVKDWLPDIKNGQSGRTSEEGASQACDISSDDWDIEWDMDF
ncbi:zinc finger BED domain-containing protein RICESLEEPER 2-like [Daucus carota subsp. sativus]|uniref:zinc finger BED domain-containing protein RICESLEEPER 2-like n=1 Tax=Daucus carota subsp. sativus TaxID=79200 RepID=UPI0007F0281D|nr:PREDICTED: zinc finger BED domain-containing protein RICESLEEPER 2-like [Daucus carota subsp. sativus]